MIWRNRLVRDAVWIFLFWWPLLTALAFGFMLQNEQTIVYQLLGRVAPLVVGAVVGALLMLLGVAVERYLANLRLAPTSMHGLDCSIGKMPLPAPPPKQSLLRKESLETWLAAYPDLKNVYLFFKSSEVTRPHAEAFLAVYHTLATDPLMPAGSIKGSHGDRSLLQHSISVAQKIVAIAQTYSYIGARRRDGTVRLPPRDGNYKFSPTDPLIPLLGLAHDIGKLRCFKRIDGGIVVEGEHDVVGAKMLALMPEIRSLPVHEREILITAIAHYHHPLYMPLDQDNKANLVIRCDRTQALMELLILADEAVGQEEGGIRIEYNNAAGKLVESVDAMPQRCWESFFYLLTGEGRLNGGDTSERLGWKHGDYIYVDEARLRAAMHASLRIFSEPSPIEGAPMVTYHVLNALAEKGALLAEHRKIKVKPHQALFSIVFAPAEGSTAVPVIYDHIIIFRYASVLPSLSIGDCQMIPSIRQFSKEVIGATTASGPADQPRPGNQNAEQTSVHAEEVPAQENSLRRQEAVGLVTPAVLPEPDARVSVSAVEIPTPASSVRIFDDADINEMGLPILEENINVPSEQVRSDELPGEQYGPSESDNDAEDDKIYRLVARAQEVEKLNQSLVIGDEKIILVQPEDQESKRKPKQLGDSAPNPKNIDEIGLDNAMLDLLQATSAKDAAHQVIARAAAPEKSAVSHKALNDARVKISELLTDPLEHMQAAGLKFIRNEEKTHVLFSLEAAQQAGLLPIIEEADIAQIGEGRFEFSTNAANKRIVSLML